jgi:SAM-dependent methyltransferase
VSSPSRPSRLSRPDGSAGWDEYAPFYDWENARTLGRRDVPFWRRFTKAVTGPVLELGCGTGRVSLPLAQAGVDLVGIDRSAPMLARAKSGARSDGAPAARRVRGGVSFRQAARLVRGDIRALPFPNRTFAAVIAPYGILQSLITPRDLAAALASVSRVLAPGGSFAIDLVPDVANWREYTNRQQFRGRFDGETLTLFESVRRDCRRRLTTFEERFVLGSGPQAREHRFDLVFRTLTMPDMKRRLQQAGFAIEATLGDYAGGRWSPTADVWILLAKKV